MLQLSEDERNRINKRMFHLKSRASFYLKLPLRVSTKLLHIWPLKSFIKRNKHKRICKKMPKIDKSFEFVFKMHLHSKMIYSLNIEEINF